jgi:hypothetical protein
VAHSGRFVTTSGQRQATVAVPLVELNVLYRLCATDLGNDDTIQVSASRFELPSQDGFTRSLQLRRFVAITELLDLVDGKLLLPLPGLNGDLLARHFGDRAKGRCTARTHNGIQLLGVCNHGQNGRHGESQSESPISVHVFLRREYL